MQEETGDSEDRLGFEQAIAHKPLVSRSTPVPQTDYRKYRESLRKDFCHSCAYCNITEVEAQSIRFTIDHYEPKNHRPDLVADYTNLMWTCDLCNSRKQDAIQPSEARDDGIRFYKADEDEYAEHFRLDGERLEALTKTGWYTDLMLELNRLNLRRLRRLRRDARIADAYVRDGVAALKHYKIDEIPPSIRGRAYKLIHDLSLVADELADDVEKVLSAYARSVMIDLDPEAEKNAKDRAEKMHEPMALYPGGMWRAPRPPKTR